MAPKEPHVLAEEEAEERRLEKNEYQRLYDAKPVNKERKRLYEEKSETKAKRRKANQRGGCVEAMRMLARGLR
jgi:hypothetical protein